MIWDANASTNPQLYSLKRVLSERQTY